MFIIYFLSNLKVKKKNKLNSKIFLLLYISCSSIYRFKFITFFFPVRFKKSLGKEFTNLGASLSLVGKRFFHKACYVKSPSDSSDVTWLLRSWNDGHYASLITSSICLSIWHGKKTTFLKLQPNFDSNFWLFVLKLISLPQLRSQTDQVDYTVIAPLSLSPRKFKLFS